MAAMDDPGHDLLVKLFECPACRGPLFFVNLTCGRCGSSVEYIPETDTFGLSERPCANRDSLERCNWRRTGSYACSSCVLDVDARPSSQRAPFQRAKRRVLRQLGRYGVEPATHTPLLRFDLRASDETEQVTTGHADGLVTIDTAESDPGHRERLRVTLGEPYRTPLGHVRHEVGHWWWAVWSSEAPEAELAATREVFGDDRVDYHQALAAHYDRSDDGTWQEAHISFYASSHPFEDFAESFAHFLHMEGTLETAVVHGVVAAPETDGIEAMLELWPPLTVALNELSRSMGTDEPYPFAPSATAIAKVRTAASTLGGAPPEAHS